MWAFGYYWRGKTAVKLRWRRIWIYPSLVWRTLSIGLAPFLQQLMSAVIVASLQYSFSKWMGDEASRTAEIASVGVFNGALILVLMLSLMLTCKTLPLKNNAKEVKLLFFTKLT
jgi:branched-subunit amino acid ABC-type transport system permease component